MDLLNEYGLIGKTEKMVLKKETYAIIGACMEVHKTLGRSFSEKVYQADFICYDKVIVELKAVSELDNENREQVINYLHVANKQVGLLVNFRTASLTHERFVNFDFE